MILDQTEFQIESENYNYNDCYTFLMHLDSVWCKINRKSIITTQIWFNLIGLQNKTFCYPIKLNQICIVIILFLLILHQTEF